MRPATTPARRPAGAAGFAPPSARRAAPIARAAPRGGDWLTTLPPPLLAAARAPWFTVGVQGGVALVVAAAVDAAYSGDWSRIGAISKETEEGLKPLVNALAAFHVVCAAVAARAAASQGRNPAAAAAKAAAVGFLAAVEAVLAEDASA